MGSEDDQLKASPIDSNQSKSARFTQELPAQYNQLGKLSEGGMGAIYKVQNRYTNALFAIKVLKPECAHNEENRKRFIAEAKAASSLNHPCICQVHDFGFTPGGLPYLVMEWIDGTSLQEIVKSKGPLSVGQAMFVFEQVAAAMSHAHQHKVVHRDLKPANIMLSGCGKDESLAVHLVDFGIAKVLNDEGDPQQTQGLTKTGIVLGTPLYMSPEQAKGVKIDGRSDIYSLGCVMYFALTGHPPFMGESFVDTIVQHLSFLPPKIDPKLKVPADLKMIMLRAMEKHSDDRYQSMDQLFEDLKKVAEGVSLKHWTLSSQKQKVHRRIVTVLCFVLGFIVMYVASIFIQSLPDVGSPDSNINMPTVKDHLKNNSQK